MEFPKLLIQAVTLVDRKVTLTSFSALRSTQRQQRQDQREAYLRNYSALRQLSLPNGWLISRNVPILPGRPAKECDLSDVTHPLVRPATGTFGLSPTLSEHPSRGDWLVVRYVDNGSGIAEVRDLKNDSTNIAQKLTEVHQLIYFRQLPFWQYPC